MSGPQPSLVLCYAAALAVGLVAGLLTAAAAFGQEQPANILRPFDAHRIRSTWPAGTERLECSSTSPSSAVALIVSEVDATAGVPLAVTPLEVRCRACNAVGCSDVSPNAVTFQRQHPGDCNRDWKLDVRDIPCIVSGIFATP